ncbi:S-adenosyl-L-methionine-dependent methyltransferase [Polychytrium aggregatum]|uniref:S-adenosyl-L-methionine-dependent methyltransferase n=1 Tax=Polychytrium aggregatum TaxID=110093 RepID=UPI0022FED491|nr:S-adenosyl-L-methionine-dependent methyltransferase [Polychytrium aggregatum]KAI9203223.1 S-adenosyl-L-methionine-dependent methyltransferase [Polychytrium aggregatum]
MQVSLLMREINHMSSLEMSKAISARRTRQERRGAHKLDNSDEALEQLVTHFGKVSAATNDTGEEFDHTSAPGPKVNMSWWRQPKNQILAAGGLGVYMVASYASFHVYRIYSAPEPPPNISNPAFQAAQEQVYDRIAKDYDDSIGLDEFLMGLGSKRQAILKHAQGSVLEVSGGTGRNFAFYKPSKVSQLVITDKSAQMLQRAWAKHKTQHQTQVPTTLYVMSANKLDWPAEAFDTVVDTFGICSFSDPIAALKEMARVCKPGGKILLLEHGRSDYEWINSALDKTATAHAESWGCWWNRDVLGLVREAGLDVVETKRYHFGTTYHIVAQPGGSKSA